MLQLHEYEIFLNLGHNVTPGGNYKLIKVHIIYAVKHDGRHRARNVGNGNLTAIPINSVYSGVVSLCDLNFLIFIAKLNELDVWSTDIGSAYLEAFTSELVYIIAGPEFGKLEGCIFIIVKALYGLRTSGSRWHDRLYNVLLEQGFIPSKNEPDIWLWRNGAIYEYIAVYVDDLALALVEPMEFTDILSKRYKFKLKGTGPIQYHLRCDFSCDEDGTLCMAPKKYIERIVDAYKRMFGQSSFTKYHSSLEKGDHPEIDTSELLDQKGIEQYQSIICML